MKLVFAALKRPVSVLVEDVGLGTGTCDEHAERTLARVGLGGCHEGQGLAAVPVMAEEYRQGRSDGVGAGCVAVVVHHVLKLLDRGNSFTDFNFLAGNFSQTEAGGAVGALVPEPAAGVSAILLAALFAGTKRLRPRRPQRAEHVTAIVAKQTPPEIW